ncbi:MAG: addiction module protein [Polyangiaceae bacterium]|jgi:putative addiction module component (TIGR02574 family)|nr:addiction module protein [Polyangiaceae bacterium]
MAAAKDLRREVLNLSREERAGLARDLIESLDPARDDDAEQAWLDEAERRATEVTSGQAELEDWADVRERIAKRLQALRQ